MQCLFEYVIFYYIIHTTHYSIAKIYFLKTLNIFISGFKHDFGSVAFIFLPYKCWIYICVRNMCIGLNDFFYKFARGLRTVCAFYIYVKSPIGIQCERETKCCILVLSGSNEFK